MVKPGLPVPEPRYYRRIRWICGCVERTFWLAMPPVVETCPEHGGSRWAEYRVERCDVWTY